MISKYGRNEKLICGGMVGGWVFFFCLPRSVVGLTDVQTASGASYLPNIIFGSVKYNI